MISLKIVIALTLLASSLLLKGQEATFDQRDKMQLSFKIGLNYSDVFDENGVGFQSDPKFGFVGGIALSIPISTYIGLQPEILYSEKGFKGNGNILGVDYKFTRTSTFLDIPLLIALKPSEFLTIVAGPQYSYLLKQKDQFNSTSSSFSQEEEFKNDNYRKNIIGVVVGADLHIKHFVIGARMCYDIQKNHGNGTSSTPQYKNKWLQATIAYNLYHHE